VEIIVTRCTKLDADRAVVHVLVDDISINSLWVVGRASGKPRVSWPETKRGHPIVEAAPALRARIDKMVLAAVDDPLEAVLDF